MSNGRHILIDFKNGEICHYSPSEYTDYKYDGEYFIVVKDKQWIGFYNLDEIRYIKVNTMKETENAMRYTFYKEKEGKDEIYN